MLQDIISSYPRGNARTLPNWTYVNNYLDARTEVWIKRFDLSSPTFTQGIELLKFLVLNIDLEYILTLSDVDKFSLILEALPDSFKTAYDPVYSGRIAKGLFTALNSKVPEYILNTSYDRPSRIYPFDQPWNDNWKELRGFKLLYHDANELVGDLLNWRIEFSSYIPSYIAYSIDATTLGFKYVKYVEYCRANGMEDPLASSFIHQFELRRLFEDFSRIWRMNFLLSILNSDDPEATAVTTAVPPFYFSIPMIKRAMKDVVMMKENLISGNIRPQDFFTSNWFGKEGNLFTLIETMNKTTMLPPGRQYLFLLTLQEMPYLSLMLQCHKLCTNADALNTQIRLKLGRLVRDAYRQQLQNNIPDSNAKAVYKEQMETLLSLT